MVILPIMNDAKKIEEVLCYRNDLNEEEKEQFYSAGEEFVECLQKAIKETGQDPYVCAEFPAVF